MSKVACFHLISRVDFMNRYNYEPSEPAAVLPPMRLRSE